VPSASAPARVEIHLALGTRGMYHQAQTQGVLLSRWAASAKILEVLSVHTVHTQDRGS